MTKQLNTYRVNIGGPDLPIIVPGPRASPWGSSGCLMNPLWTLRLCSSSSLLLGGEREIHFTAGALESG